MNNNNESVDTIITDAIKKMTEISDVNMIVGRPIKTSKGTTIIPISKITVGFLSGCGEYGEVNFFKNKNGFPYSGASGGLLSLKPSGFLVECDGDVKFVHCPTDVIEKAFDSCEEILKNINEKTSNN